MNSNLKAYSYKQKHPLTHVPLFYFVQYNFKSWIWSHIKNVMKYQVFWVTVYMKYIVLYKITIIIFLFVLSDLNGLMFSDNWIYTNFGNDSYLYYKILIFMLLTFWCFWYVPLYTLNNNYSNVWRWQFKFKK